jgi:regulator of protease activity HflC (stomatin/prohibitin superfamily)
MLLLNLVLYVVAVWVLVYGIAHHQAPGFVLWFIGALILGLLVSGGFFVVNPNEAAVLLLFGAYRGTEKGNGFHWTSPFIQRMRVSLRARTRYGEKSKVNDRLGNPIEIASVVVWQVQDTAQAKFDVDNYVDYVNTQSETALRHLASSYPYDAGEEEISLRGATDEVNHHLQRQLQERLQRAGVVVLEARLSHLAYASEIAGAMLRRQQATAVIAARKKMVEGAVGMVEDALRGLAQTGLVQLDDERKASMVSNLLVVLCSEHGAQPVVNAGTLYQ